MRIGPMLGTAAVLGAAGVTVAALTKGAGGEDDSIHRVPTAPLPEDMSIRNRPEPDENIRVVYKAGLERLLASPARADAEALFNNEDTYVVTLSENSRMPEGWIAHSAIAYTSFADFARDARDGMPAHVEAVLYNNEEWTWTPEGELANPEETARRFAKLAHQQGLTFIAAPHPPGEGNRLFEGDARHADILDLQVQDSESDPATYAQRVRESIEYARSVNPDVKVIAQVTSNPDKLGPAADDGIATPDEVATVVGNVAGEDAVDVDGYLPWIFDSPAGTANAAEMVRQLAALERGGRGSSA